MIKNQKKSVLWVVALLLGSTVGLADKAHAESFSMPFFNNGNNGNGISMPFFNNGNNGNGFSMPFFNNSNYRNGPGPYGPGPYGPGPYGPGPYGPGYGPGPYGPGPDGYGPGAYGHAPGASGSNRYEDPGKSGSSEGSSAQNVDLINNRSLASRNERKSKPQQ
ncbi:MAG: hypothetical protein HQL90_10320 [Magnetococcales bacterium]|nr:hypothetical protein [Magnetococcales bacterium]